MVRKLVWLAVLFVPALAQAQSVQIVQGDHSGSGSVVWRYTNYPDYGQVLTCWHVVDSNDPIEIIWKKKDRSTLPTFARVLASDKKDDIALLECYIGNTHAIVVAPNTPPVGTQITITGFGENIYTERPASIKAIENGLIRLDHPSRRGDSGGAVTHDGRLIGISVMLRRADYEGLAVPAEKIRHFLTSQAGWKFDPRSIGLPPQESQPPPQQSQPAPAQKSAARGSAFARLPDPAELLPQQNPTEQHPPQQAAPPALVPPAGGPRVAQPGGAAGNQQVAGNQQPGNPQMVQANRGGSAATERPSGRFFNLSTIMMTTTTGLSVTACLVFFVMMKRARQRAGTIADADEELRDRKPESRQRGARNDPDAPRTAGSTEKDDEWFAVWFKGGEAPSSPPDRQQRPTSPPRRKKRPRD
ncbi:MAG: trypsin-like peptidase domain-containing protein [Planctomycetia bacterium]|nr:trypsin-like peptidase domain-containing protein [Planctomycetia bacterium]